MISLVLSDPFQVMKEWFAANTTMPGWLVLVLLGIVAVVLSQGVVMLARRLAREGRWFLLSLLVVAFGFLTFLYWNRTFGLLVMLAAAAYVFRKPLAGLFRAIGGIFRRRRGRARASSRDSR